MPGYVDWKIRNCPLQAVNAAASFNQTVQEVEPYLQRIWLANGESFPPDAQAALDKVVSLLEQVPPLLAEATKQLANAFLPGAPAAAPSTAPSPRTCS